MGLEHRPYVGSWQLGQQQLVQHTPDALVYVNGDTAVPGCPKCNGRIDLQEFVTEISVDAGTDAGSSTANFTLSVPVHHHDAFARDAQFIMRPGLEIHIYMRGYFPTKGLYSSLAEPVKRFKAGADTKTTKTPLTSDDASSEAPWVTSTENLYDYRKLIGRGVTPTEQETRNLKKVTRSLTTLHRYMEQLGYTGVWIKSSDGLVRKHHVKGSLHYSGKAVDYVVNYVDDAGNQREVDRNIVWASVEKLQQSGHLPKGGQGAYLKRGQTPNSHPRWSGHLHFDVRGRNSRWVWQQDGGENTSYSVKRAWLRALRENIKGLPDPEVVTYQGVFKKGAGGSSTSISVGVDPSSAEEPSGDTQEDEILGVVTAPSTLEQMGLDGFGVENQLAYPYYQVFHGVVTQASHSWSAGVNTVSIQCASMLHFWQYHTISTNASVFGARPKEGKLRTSMVGHNFTGMHPYQILYTLHHDMVGAAGGVSWALSQKTNQRARSEVDGESLFKLNIKYWQQRFDVEEIKLRLHGASGELFNTAQAAFLSQTSGSALTRLLRHRFTDITSRKNRPKGILEQAISLGLFRDRKLEALNLSRKSRGTTRNNTRFEINLPEMQAFVTNVSNWGQVNLFESSYESKLDIAKKVCEVTGFEFYQDVDGDFVFKPPFYNMDTSASRVYRIEDIDIINISFSEKEPEVTYITGKNAHFKNFGGSGVENEWGVKGQYIDYRLVAQFGWRPADFETSYLNDRKALFFAAVNRLDILNAPINSASVTIPLRPEMRPGYPVFIPYLDCFYYCNSFSHSYSNGGQCTTSLQLIAKRAKFYAPGKVHGGVSGIKAIDLSNTSLPERPLGIVDAQGRPRLAGFPNVVMALDPKHLNSMFFVVGSEMERIDDVNVLRNLLERGREFKLIKKAAGSDVWVMTLPASSSGTGGQATKDVYFWLQDPTNPKSAKPDVEGATVVDLVAAAGEYTQRRKEWASGTGVSGKRRTALEKEVVGLKEKISNATASIQKLNESLFDQDAKTRAEIRLKIERLDQLVNGFNKNNSSYFYQSGPKKGHLKKEGRKLLGSAGAKDAVVRRKILEGGWEGLLQEKQSQLEKNAAAFDKALSRTTKNGVAYLLTLIRAVGEQFLAENPNYRNLNSTINLLDMLSDKKASFSSGTQPGSYRYYSASHPEAVQQGQNSISYEETIDGKREINTKDASFLDPQWQGTTVQGFKKNPRAPWPGAKVPEAELGEIEVKRGIRVLTSNPNAPNGEVLPTSEIHELMFTVQSTTLVRSKKAKTTVGTVADLGPDVEGAIQSRFTLSSAAMGSGRDLVNTTTEDLYLPVWQRMYATVRRAVAASRTYFKASKNSKKIVPEFPEMEFPTVFLTADSGGDFVPVTTQYGDFFLKDNPDGITPWSNDGAEKTTLNDAAGRAGEQVAADFYKALNDARSIWAVDLALARFSPKTLNDGMAKFSGFLASAWGVNVGGRKVRRSVSRKGRLKRVKSFSPVFPVSDSKGYEVIGSYRYGRGVSIEPNNVWNSMARMDPLSLLDRKTVEDVLNAFVRGKRVQVDTVDSEGNPIVVTTNKGKPNAGAGEQALEKEVLRQLRRNLTDAQIIDLFQLDTADPNVLDFSLSNWFADKGRDGIHKLPAINAALSLANLNQYRSKQVCACKAAEADVLLDVLGNEDFVSFVKPGNAVPEGFRANEADDPTRWQVMMTGRASASWVQSQKALRGQVLDKKGSTITQAFSDFNKTLNDDGARARAQAQQALDSRVNLIGQQANAVGESTTNIDVGSLVDPTVTINGEGQ